LLLRGVDKGTNRYECLNPGGSPAIRGHPRQARSSGEHKFPANPRLLTQETAAR